MSQEDRNPAAATPDVAEREAPIIDVIVPVFRGLEETRRCLESVLASPTTARFELVAVDDCSPEPEAVALLDELAAAGRLTLLRNEVNRGFVASVNRGMSLHPDRDVVLLNSDTEVANDWLDRIVAAARRHPDAATLTPFSNNATICSYPAGGDSELPGTLDLAALDALFARTLAGAVIELPTAVGFCMFIRRTALDALGSFDEQTFGRGYGEENDFSRRAAKAGWRNLLCADVYVRHRGSVSFGADRFELMRAGASALRALHPEYDQVVHSFVEADPAAPLRAAIDAARRALGGEEAEAVANELARLAAETRQTAKVGTDAAVPACSRSSLLPQDLSARKRRDVLLHICHNWGGGTQRWIDDFAAADEQCWNLLLRSRSGRSDAGERLELVDLDAGCERVLQAWDLRPSIAACSTGHAQYRELIQSLVTGFEVRAIAVSSLIGHSLDVFDCGVPTCVVMHDLFPFCPALFGYFGKDCTECGERELASCLRGNPFNAFWQHGPARTWVELREAYAKRLAAAHVVLAAPSASVRERYATLFPPLRAKHVSLIPHGLAFVPPASGPREDVERGALPSRLRLVIPGRLLPHKGLSLLQRVLPAIGDFADVLLLGAGQFGAPFATLAHVRIVDDYGPTQLAGHIAAFAPDCALLASLLPETFSYLLSEMRALGVPVVATARGALAERIEDGQDGYLVAPEASAIEAKLRDLADRRDDLLRMAEHLRARPVRTAADMVDAYHKLLGVSSASPPSRATLLYRTAVLEGARLRADLLAIEEERQGERDEVRRLGDQLAHLVATVSTLAAEREEFAQAHARSEFEVQCLREQLASVIEEKNAILASTSWRATKPLRQLLDAVRRAQPASSVPPSADDEGGVTLPVASESDGEAAPARLVCHRAGDIIGGRWAGRIGDVHGLEVAALSEAEMNAQFGPAVVLATNGGASAGGDELPLIGDWGGKWKDALNWLGADRTRLRGDKREQLFLPDATRIVVGMAGASGFRALAGFARLAMAVSEQVNGCAFVWIGRDDYSGQPETGLEVKLPIALRRLFVIDDVEFEAWLLAADLYMDTGCAEACDPGAREARACGLTVSSCAELDLDECVDCIRSELQALALTDGGLTAHLPIMEDATAFIARFGPPVETGGGR